MGGRAAAKSDDRNAGISPFRRMAGENGGQILYSGPPKRLESVRESRTRPYLFGEEKPRPGIVAFQAIFLDSDHSSGASPGE